jgi:hypothetical protein
VEIKAISSGENLLGEKRKVEGVLLIIAANVPSPHSSCSQRSQ